MSLLTLLFLVLSLMFLMSLQQEQNRQYHLHKRRLKYKTNSDAGSILFIPFLKIDV